MTISGEVRWTGPGHPYGPEYNDDNEVMFSVLFLVLNANLKKVIHQKVLSKCKKNLYLHTFSTMNCNKDIQYRIFFGKILIFITESQMRGFAKSIKKYCLVFLENAQTSKDCLAHYCRAN